MCVWVALRAHVRLNWTMNARSREGSANVRSIRANVKYRVNNEVPSFFKRSNRNTRNNLTISYIFYYFYYSIRSIQVLCAQKNKVSLTKKMSTEHVFYIQNTTNNLCVIAPLNRNTNMIHYWNLFKVSNEVILTVILFYTYA